MIIVKTESEIGRMRESGRIAARVRDRVAEKVGPGVKTIELGDYAAELIRGFGAKSAFLGYRGYPGQICVSVNEAVVHGIPGKQVIRAGDIVSIDVGVEFEGFIGDTATTVMVSVADAEVMMLVDITQKALAAGIAKAKAGNRLSDISHAVESVVVKGGCSVVREFVGHGIGRSMHEDPQIPNFGLPGRGPKLEKGMTLAIEPMVNLGGSEVEMQDDGWTVLTRDGKPSAHFEHTVVVGRDGGEILTA
jgi:methionyl aminopeptidase